MRDPHFHRCWAIILGGACLLSAQDRRNVTEPRFPKTCTTLTARLSAPSGVLPEASERNADTERIQRAIDQCRPGRAVELKAAGDTNVFLAGPLQLKPGITLLIRANTALFASRNPRDYDTACSSLAAGPRRVNLRAGWTSLHIAGWRDRAIAQPEKGRGVAAHQTGHCLSSRTQAIQGSTEGRHPQSDCRNCASRGETADGDRTIEDRTRTLSTGKHLVEHRKRHQPGGGRGRAQRRRSKTRCSDAAVAH